MINVTDFTLYLYYKSSDNKVTYFKIGDKENEISLSLISSLKEYVKNKDTEPVSFSEYLAEAVYNNLSQAEKDFSAIANEDSEGLANAQIVVKLDSSEESINLLNGLPTEEFLKDLKQSELYEFNLKENLKYQRKMDKITGNLPLNEMYLDVAGTNTRLSNIHVTDIERLNNMRINSNNF